MSDEAHKLPDDLVVSSDTLLFDALQRVSRNGVGRLVVLDGDRLVGYVALKDIVHLLILKRLPSRPIAAGMLGTVDPRGARRAA